MVKKFRTNTIQARIFLYFLIVAIGCCITAGGYFLYAEQRTIRNNIQADTEQKIEFASGQIEETALRVEEFANEISASDTIRALLDGDSAANSKVQAAEQLENQFQFVTIAEDILSLFIVGENDLDLRHGKEAALIDLSLIRQQFCQDTQDAQWGKLQENPCRYSNYRKVIPYCTTMWDADHQKVLGHLVILLRPDVFLNVGNVFLSQAEEAFAIADQAGDSIAENAAWENLREQADVTSFDQGADITYNGNEYFLFSRAMDSFPWILMTATPANELAQQTVIVRRAILIAVLLAFLLSVFLSSIFSNSISQPIRRIAEEVEDIAQGNFEKQIHKDTTDELLKLEDSIEKMQGDLKTMVDDLIRQEEEKSEAEIQMLRAQINPHFLYNTLNSIKMMAVMQGSRGIQNMTEALGDILRESLSSNTEENSLRDELKLMDKYIYIQNIRYKGNIEYSAEVRNQELYDFRMQKFLLQPIIENAISHGVEYENQGGRIQVTVWREDDDVLIEVKDDGEGIPGDILERLNRHERVTNRSIGVHNVDRRLHKLYGDGYGLRFDSVWHEYTSVTLKLRMKDRIHEENQDTDC